MDSAEDRKYWENRYQRKLSDAEYAEIKFNLVQFTRLMTNQALKVDNTEQLAKSIDQRSA